VAKKPGIKTFSNCFNEMKRLSGDSLSDKEINEFLDEIKIKINEDKFREGEAKTEKILQEEIYNDFEYQQAFKKREIAENNIKAINAVSTNNRCYCFI
jgi:UDP-galactopyranose mutase